MEELGRVAEVKHAWAALLVVLLLNPNQDKLL